VCLRLSFLSRSWLDAANLSSSQIQQELNELLTVALVHFSNRIGQQNDPNQMLMAILKAWRAFNCHLLPTFLGIFLPIDQWLEDAIDMKQVALLRFRDQIVLHWKDKLQGKTLVFGSLV
jgi:hypothetical protein